MRVLDRFSSVTTRARSLVARLTAPPPPPQLPKQSGPELARQCLGDAAVALLDKGATQAETFRLLRLELNRLEQGGLAARAAEAPVRATVEVPPPSASAQLASWALGELRARSRDFAARVLRAA